MFPIEKYDERFLREIFRISDEHSLPEIPPNYPPFYSWDACLGHKPGKIMKLWQESNSINKDRIPTIYIHLPFCEYICKFCGFYRKIPLGKEIDLYLEALKKEALFLKPAFKNLPIRNLCFGGGTPTMLSDKQLKFLFGIFKENFTIAEETRIAIEASPQTLTLEKAKLLKKLGVNYLSVGIQSFNEKLMRTLSRPQTEKDAIAALRNAKEAGIENVEADLIVGLPGQTEEIFMKDIEILSKFDLERVYIFDWQPRQFSFPKGKHGASLDSLRINRARDWRRRGIEELIKKQGYTMRCGHWIFKRKGEEWPYTYDQQEEEGYSVLGLGATSITYCADRQRYQNISSVSGYVNFLKKKLLPIDRIAFLSKDDEMRNYALIKFIHIGQLIISHFKKKYKIHPYSVFKKEIDFLIKSGLLKESYDSYVLSDRERAIFELRAVFYPVSLIEKIAKKAKLDIVLKNKDNRFSFSQRENDFKNSKILPLRDISDFDALFKTDIKAGYLPLKKIASMFAEKRAQGIDDLILYDIGHINEEKMLFFAKLAAKMGFREIYFMVGGVKNSYGNFFKKIAASGVKGFIVYPEKGKFYFPECASAQKNGLSVSLIKKMDFEDLKSPQKFLKEARRFSSGRHYFFIGENEKFNYEKFYSELKKSAGNICRAAENAGIDLKIINSLPCLLRPYHKKLFDNFLKVVGDARENTRNIIKLEACMVCRYLLYCPGPAMKYLQELKNCSGKKDVKFYSVKAAKFFKIRPIKK